MGVPRLALNSLYSQTVFAFLPLPPKELEWKNQALLDIHVFVAAVFSLETLSSDDGP